MACRIAIRTIFLTEPWLPFPFLRNKLSTFTPIKKISTPNLSCGCKIALNSKSYQFSSNCSNKGNSSPSSDDSEQGPPQEAVLKAISEVSKAEGRVGQTTNVVIGGTVTDDSTNEWLALDQKVNSYPTVRGFTAIGTGGDDFVHAMVVAVESVLQKSIPEGQVKQKMSSGGKYVSVNIGPVQVVSSEQVQAVYNAMRRDDRMKYFL
ncbi:phosphoribosylformylglycinamidine synthase [Perilla frutescens var. hirtella]|uniref:Phosphoribosylformylglycinamidine synthase n=1 Tax=Perilla frutescens var. hirtella TaxID=608512 RepID=A0AAD4J197_PERFH|nr:phosphoribosylformylglycinamidine synthase [Perilla frutescens var. hirtella]KAH6798453.1 phosphoribosylformylglycinamidine synthase [Perilla frutescens var. frutescens]KAH6806964.1 phosphoribosylformylglycinamidine synthase [Perilla frutescens var. frutescens]KAH6824895.1 phosphoribosylformylglycinamidine synthase [Perilla frutescens var. hirtella]